MNFSQTGGQVYLQPTDKKDDWKLRFSYKLTDLQAAIIRSQLPRLKRNVAARRRLADAYRSALDPTRLRLPPPHLGATWFRYVVRASGGFERAARRFERAGIDIARPVYRPLHTLLGLPARRFPHAEDRFLTAMSLPIYPDLRDSDLRRIVAVANRL